MLYVIMAVITPAPQDVQCVQTILKAEHPLEITEIGSVIEKFFAYLSVLFDVQKSLTLIVWIRLLTHDKDFEGSVPGPF
jgi:hypothetical protein